jgi:hypothetical protein
MSRELPWSISLSTGLGSLGQSENWVAQTYYHPTTTVVVDQRPNPKPTHWAPLV